MVEALEGRNSEIFDRKHDADRNPLGPDNIPAHEAAEGEDGAGDDDGEKDDDDDLHDYD